MNALRNLFAVLFMAFGVTVALAAEPAHDHSHGASAAPAAVAASKATPGVAANVDPNASPSGEACPMMQGGKPGMGGMQGRRGMMGGEKPRAQGPEHCPMHASAASCPKHDAMQKRMQAVEQRLDALERAAKSATQPVTK